VCSPPPPSGAPAAAAATAASAGDAGERSCGCSGVGSAPGAADHGAVAAPQRGTPTPAGETSAAGGGRSPLAGSAQSRRVASRLAEPVERADVGIAAATHGETPDQSAALRPASPAPSGVQGTAPPAGAGADGGCGCGHAACASAASACAPCAAGGSAA
jgi:hypothetical protein